MRRANHINLDPARFITNNHEAQRRIEYETGLTEFRDRMNAAIISQQVIGQTSRRVGSITVAFLNQG